MIREMKKQTIAENDTKKPDYLKPVFEAIEKANLEMKKYGAALSWEFKITPYYPPVKKV
jgi:hypothetical protein